MKTEPTSVLVIGAGVGGIRAALDLAEVGYKVRLIDQSPHIGGILAELDYQFPNNHCGMCRMLPMVDRESASQYCMRKGLFHKNIDIMPFTEVVEVSGEPGAFAVDVVRKTRQVNTDRCIGCGTCVDVCPVEVDDEFNEGLAKRKAIFRPVPHNIPNMYIIDQNHCTKCGKCMIHCPTQAVDLFVVDTHETLEVGAIIYAGGTGFFDPRSLSDQYGFGEHPDVITSLQFERLISDVGAYRRQVDQAFGRKEDRKHRLAAVRGVQKPQASAGFFAPPSAACSRSRKRCWRRISAAPASMPPSITWICAVSKKAATGTKSVRRRKRASGS